MGEITRMRRSSPAPARADEPGGSGWAAGIRVRCRSAWLRTPQASVRPNGYGEISSSGRPFVSTAKSPVTTPPISSTTPKSRKAVESGYRATR